MKWDMKRGVNVGKERGRSGENLWVLVVGRRSSSFLVMGRKMVVEVKGKEERPKSRGPYMIREKVMDRSDSKYEGKRWR